MWFAVHASNAAQAASAEILTQRVRLPIPTWEELERMRTYAASFEMPVWPICCEYPSRLLSPSGARSSDPDPPDPWGLEESGEHHHVGHGPPRTFKRLGGRTHIANSSRTGAFKRPGAGEAIRAPATQTLPPVAGGGKITHRHPHLPAMESLSPRLRRLVNGQCGSEAKTLGRGVTTCQAAACHADSVAQFAEKLGSANIGLQSVWRLADVEFDAHLAACARVERVAHMHTPRVHKPLPCSR